MDDAYPYPDAPPAEYRAAILWLRGAAEVNANAGSQSDFIRAYNKAQVEARTGQTLSDAEMDAVSNAVAQEVYDKLMSGPTAEFPTIDALASDDAAPAAETIFEENTGGWAGNHLFLLLGYSDAFYSNVVEPGSSTYDAVAMIKFTDEAFGAANWFDGIVQTLAYPSGALTYLAGMSALDTFLSAAYACVPQTSYMNGDRNFIRSFSNITLGRTAESDSLSGTDSSDFIHGGGGNDTIFGSLGRDVIDGAEGRDVVDYSHLDSARQFNLIGTAQSTADYVGYVTGTGLLDILQASLFGIEEIRGGSQSDEFRVSSLADALERIDGGENGAEGDLLSFADVVQGVALNLQVGTLVIGEVQVEVAGFERIEGSSHNDVIIGNDGANILYGADGADSLFGGGADDFIFFDFADGGNVYGGAGRDVAVALGDDGVTVDMAAQGLECVIGCDGDDTITVSNENDPVFAAGGGGSDHFILDNLEAYGPRILWGGSGADVFEFQNGGCVSLAVVNIDGLTEEAFSRLTLEDLGLGEINVSWLSAIFINPDATDRFYSDDGVLGTSSVNLRDWWDFGDDPELLDLLLPGSAPVSLDVRTSDVPGGTYAIQGVFRNEVRALHEITLQYNYYDVTVRSDGGYDVVDTETYEEYLIRYNLETDSMIDTRSEVIEDALRSAERLFAQWDEYDYGDITSEYWTVQARSDIPTGPFYVVGGEFAGTVLSANDDLSGTLPDDPGPSPFDWLLAA